MYVWRPRCWKRSPAFPSFFLIAVVFVVFCCVHAKLLFVCFLEIFSEKKKTSRRAIADCWLTERGRKKWNEMLMPRFSKSSNITGRRHVAAARGRSETNQRDKDQSLKSRSGAEFFFFFINKRNW